MIRKQHENYERELNEAKYRKQFLQKQYGDDLRKIVQEREVGNEIERVRRQQEAAQLNENLEYKKRLETEQHEKSARLRQDLSDHYQNVVNFKN
jgi:hypothetical protein